MSGMVDLTQKAFLIGRKHAAPMRTTPTDKVLAVAFFKDGRRFVTGSSDNTLRIWDVEKGVLIGEPFEGHNGWVQSFAVSPDDRRIASGGRDNTIIIWDVESKQMIFGRLAKHTRWVWSVCFSPDGKRLASGSKDCTVILWDAESGAVLSTLKGDYGICSVAFSPDGLKLASGSFHNIRVWRTDNFELLLDIDAHKNYVQGIVWSPDGRQLVSASYDKVVQFWNSSNGYRIDEACIHTDYINSLVISSNGSFIATASLDMTVRLWNTRLHRQISQPYEHTAGVACVAISPNPNGKLLVSGDYEGKVWLWSIEKTLSAANSSSRVQNLYPEALPNAEQAIVLSPWSYIGYELRCPALHGVQRYGDAIEVFKTTCSKLDNVPDPQIQKPHQQHVGRSEELAAAIRKAVDDKLENAPLRLLNTSTGRLCNREAQINSFMGSTEYSDLFHLSAMHAPLQMESINEAVTKYFSWVMLSHRWASKEPELLDIQNKDVYTLHPVGTIVKLQRFCEVARNAGYRWAWSDTCCINQNDIVERQESINSMFAWYRHSALTIVYLSDVPPSSNSGALANSSWITRGWTVQEFLAPDIILFYQADWTLYLDACSPNHKKSVAIMQELVDSTGIDAQEFVAFRPGMRGARVKLQWASRRVTTLQEDIAYSLVGIFGINLHVKYGEKKQNALGRLLQKIIARSGDITALDWVGRSSDFNSCLPADISSYQAPPRPPPSLSEDEIQTSVSMLRNTVAMESVLKLRTRLDNLCAPRFAASRLQLPCIAFPVTEVRRMPSQDQETRSTYQVKTDGLHDLLITTEDGLIQFSPANPIQQIFLLIRPWNRYDFELPDFADKTQSMDDMAEPRSRSHDPRGQSPGDNEPADSQSHTQELGLIARLGQCLCVLFLFVWLGQQPELGLIARHGQHFGALLLGQWRGIEPADSQSHMRELRLIVRLGQSFGALLLAQQRGGEYKRIASDHNITARVRNMASVDDMMDIRTIEVL